jgi:hypothetical protein
MKVLILGKRENMNRVTSKTTAVHFSYRPNMCDVLEVMNKTKALKKIYLSESSMKTTSKSMKKLLEMNEIGLCDAGTKFWGARTDVDQTVEINEE